MRILVLEELSGDGAQRAQSVGVRDERRANAERAPDDWRIRQIDPAAGTALDVALDLKAVLPEVRVTLVHLGPADAVHWMRDELARGCHSAVRVWSDEVAGVGTQAKAVVLAAAARASGFDFVLTGAVNATSAGGQLGVLLARHLGVPCVTQASSAVPAPSAGAPADPDRLIVTRELARGFRERVAVMLPAVVTVAAAASPARHVASLRDLLHAQESVIAVWDLAELGVPRETIRRADAALRAGDTRHPRPKHRYISAPDQSAPAFDRILQLVAGSVQRREGRVVRGTADEIAAEIFAALRRDGWLDHLGPDGPVPCEG